MASQQDTTTTPGGSTLSHGTEPSHPINPIFHRTKFSRSCWPEYGTDTELREWFSGHNDQISSKVYSRMIPGLQLATLLLEPCKSALVKLDGAHVLQHPDNTIGHYILDATYLPNRLDYLRFAIAFDEMSQHLRICPKDDPPSDGAYAWLGELVDNQCNCIGLSSAFTSFFEYVKYDALGNEQQNTVLFIFAITLFHEVVHAIWRWRVRVMGLRKVADPCFAITEPYGEVGFALETYALGGCTMFKGAPSTSNTTHDPWIVFSLEQGLSWTNGHYKDFGLGIGYNEVKKSRPMSYAEIEPFFDQRNWTDYHTWNRRKRMQQYPALEKWLYHEIHRAAAKRRQAAKQEPENLPETRSFFIFKAPTLSSMPSWRLLKHLRDLSLTHRFVAYHRYCLVKREGEFLNFDGFIEAFKSLSSAGMTPNEEQKACKLLSSAFETH